MIPNMYKIGELLPTVFHVLRIGPTHSLDI